MKRLCWVAFALALSAGCGDDGDDAATGTDTTTTTAGDGDGTGDGDGDSQPIPCEDPDSATCLEIPAGDSALLLETVNLLTDDTTVRLQAGTYELDNQVTIRANDIKLEGAGLDETILSFGTAAAQINGVDVVGNDFLVQDLTVLDAPKDGIRVEDSTGVVFRRIKATWTNEGDSQNGAYGIYPVKSVNVLVEDSIAENASDAGLYVGQAINVIVRRNTVRGNVAGLEIENTQYADVYDNLAEDNTAGIVTFDLPGNPIVGRDVRLRDNIIRNNNRPNFAPGGTVALIPAGTGSFAMASRRVEITGNTYDNNDTVDIAIISGLVVDGASKWVLETDALIGDWEDLNLLPGPTEGTVTNFRGENIVVAGNSHANSGDNPDGSRDLGAVVAQLYFGTTTPSVVYDSIGESTFNPSVPAGNSNDNHICAGGNTGGDRFGSMNLENQPFGEGLVVSAPFAPFDCTELIGGPVAEVVLP